MKICVNPLNDGWVVEPSSIFESAAFHSGGRAESHARTLATVLSQAGLDAYVIVNDRQGRRIGRRLYAAAPAEPRV